VLKLCFRLKEEQKADSANHTCIPKPGPGAKLFTPSSMDKFRGELQVNPSSRLCTIMVLEGLHW